MADLRGRLWLRPLKDVRLNEGMDRVPDGRFTVADLIEAHHCPRSWYGGVPSLPGGSFWAVMRNEEFKWTTWPGNRPKPVEEPLLKEFKKDRCDFCQHRECEGECIDDLGPITSPW